jgi:hypothetical protein
MDALFDSLQRTGEKKGKFFYTTRRAEFEHIWGDNNVAFKLIQEAVDRTPHIFEPKRLYVEILLKEGNLTKTHEILQSLKEKMNLRERDRLIRFGDAQEFDHQKWPRTAM